MLVERATGFRICAEYERFMRPVPSFERETVDDRIFLLTFSLDVGQDETCSRIAENGPSASHLVPARDRAA